MERYSLSVVVDDLLESRQVQKVKCPIANAQFLAKYVEPNRSYTEQLAPGGSAGRIAFKMQTQPRKRSGLGSFRCVSPSRVRRAFPATMAPRSFNLQRSLIN
jgi:hypothetical protein